MAAPLLNVRNCSARLGLIPTPVKLLCREAELHDEIVGEVPGFNFASFFPPQPQQRGFVLAHNNASVRTADKRIPVGWFELLSHEIPAPRSTVIGRLRPKGFVDGLGVASVISARIAVVKQLARAMGYLRGLG